MYIRGYCRPENVRDEIAIQIPVLYTGSNCLNEASSSRQRCHHLNFQNGLFDMIFPKKTGATGVCYSRTMKKVQLDFSGMTVAEPTVR